MADEVSLTSPDFLPFLSAISEAEKAPWGLCITFSPSARAGVLKRLYQAIIALGDPPLIVRPSPTRQDEIWIIPADKVAGQPGAVGPVLYPSITRGPASNGKAAT